MSRHQICGDCAEKEISNCRQNVATMEPCRLIPYREAYDALRHENIALGVTVENLRAMCEELSEAADDSLPSLHHYKCPGAAGKITQALAHYRAMTATEKEE